MKKLIAVLMMSAAFTVSAMAGWKEFHTGIQALPGAAADGTSLYKVTKMSDYDTVQTAIVQVTALYAATTNGVPEDMLPRMTLLRDTCVRLYRAILATKTVTTALSDTSNYGMPFKGSEASMFAWAAAYRLQWADDEYLNGFVAINANRLNLTSRNDESAPSPTQIAKMFGCEVTNLNTAKRNLRLKVAAQLLWKEPAFGNFPSVLTDAARRVEIIERRAAGLSVVGPTSLPKTASLTAAFNSGSGLVEALNAFGIEMPTQAVADKVAAANALKAAFDSGLKDPNAGDLGFMSTWLGVKPVADWVKQYNGQ